MTRLLLLLILLLVASFGLMPSRAEACMTAGPPGTHTAVASEAAVIVWNAQTHTEHFIRSATFESNAQTFGFLVPTPTPPHLAPAEESAFYQLDRVCQPRIIQNTIHGLRLTSWLVSLQTQSAGTTTAAMNGAAPAVEVVSEQHVGGYDAVTLRADDVAALTRWLRSHGYAIQPAMVGWLKPYVAEHWTITAFKIASPNRSASIADLPLVRMSFQTNRPFFPYSEPADQREPGAYQRDRLLRVYVLSDSRMDGTLDKASVRWPGQVQWAQSSPDFRETTQGQLEAALSLTHSQMPTPLWLTALEDRSSPRPGVADLYFQPAAQQTPLVPPPVEEMVDERIGIPIELILLVAALLVARLVGVRRASMGRT